MPKKGKNTQYWKWGRFYAYFISGNICSN